MLLSTLLTHEEMPVSIALNKEDKKVFAKATLYLGSHRTAATNYSAEAGRVEVRAREGGPGVRCRHLLECRAAEGLSVSPALLAGERGLPLGTLV